MPCDYSVGIQYVGSMAPEDPEDKEIVLRFPFLGWIHREHGDKSLNCVVWRGPTPKTLKIEVYIFFPFGGLLHQCPIYVF